MAPATIEKPRSASQGPAALRVPRRIARASRGKSVQAMATRKYRLGVDVGGTHTDLVLLDVADGALAVEKVATTPKNPAIGVMRGIANFAARGVDLSGNRIFLPRHHDHHQCAARNARRQGRPAHQPRLPRHPGNPGPGARRQSVRLFLSKPPPIAPQSLTSEIGERIDYAGAVLEPLDEDAVRAAAGAQGRRGRLDRGLLPVLLHESRARRAHRAR